MLGLESGWKVNRVELIVLVCPITSQIKGYPFEVRVISKSGINGAIGADQAKSMDWKARKAEFVEAADKNLVAAVTARILRLIESS